MLINGKDGEENVSLCKSWLERFGSWGKFVEENYMQDFVERPKNGSFGKPKELWNGHFADYLVCGCAKPDKLEQCEEFFQPV